ncbi:MAG TPA: 3-phosphoserine/phosphohydroxythreonine transaminase [bacterium]|nr:3-phosphoserine/phosphohydroxythreonine transaminase [bacterium]HPJ71233.1 3-phosphoserine/phosphohydroxythreonine transaminase [bacterium]HPQ65472.1 3-phosphoserine/phosphohydroxythreonine transaminase [bacterium]
MGKRPHNLYAGPAILPLEVLEEARHDLLDIGGTGLSLLESSHRSPLYAEINETTANDLRTLLEIPENYSILFLQGGASLQFGMIPMNFLCGGVADYVDTGAWAGKAIKEAKLFGTVNVAGSSKAENYSRIPRDLKFTPEARYVHLCSNETIGGIRWNDFPETGDVPLIADMSSEICSRVIDVSRFAMIYAGAQKNLGPSGVTVVIIRKDLLEKVPADLTTMLKYTTHAENDSNYNTPPVFTIYMVGLVLKWLKKRGGIAAMEEVNDRKAAMLYDFMDAGGYYRGTAATEDRSTMNVTFRLPSEELEKKFLAEAKNAGFLGLKGHRSVGGCRASIYNAFPVEGVEALIAFMKRFQADNS